MRIYRAKAVVSWSLKIKEGELKIMDEKITEDKKEYFLGVSILISAFIIAGAWIYTSRFEVSVSKDGLNDRQLAELQSKVISENGIILPVVWNDLGRRLAESGVIDRKKFTELYSNRQDLNEEIAKLLDGSNNGKLRITEENSGMILNLLWALGLANKNEILEKGPMSDPRFGGAGNFASTGGWTLADGDAMDHYSRHPFIVLTPIEQQLVERVSKNIYRLCCNNSTYFPDCNHGMAMLGLLELMASQGVSEEEMYKTALQVNSYWFPDTYLTIAQYLASKGIDWNDTDPKEDSGGSCGV